MFDLHHQNLHRRARPWQLKLVYGVVMLLVVALAWVGFKLWRVNGLAQALSGDLEAVIVASQPQTVDLPTLQVSLTRMQADLQALRNEVALILPLTPYLGWVPGVGPDLVAAPALLALAEDLALAGNEVTTVVLALVAPDAVPLPERIVAEFKDQQHHLRAAEAALGRARQHYASLEPASLRPDIAAALARIEPLLAPAGDLIQVALLLPDLLGAEQAQHYLILIQNPDELRPTGGFITAVGSLTVESGRLQALHIYDSAMVDHFDVVAYPPAPMPLSRYMGLAPWVLRDSNWSPDFPAAAAQASQFWMLAGYEAPDGVLAITPQMVRVLIETTGSLSLADHDPALDADEVFEYLRSTWDPATTLNASWAERKAAALNDLAASLKAGLFNLDLASAERLGPLVLQALHTRDLQLSLVHPVGAALLAQYHWNGAVQPGRSDFLMVVDANVGYNKASLHIERTGTYVVDLRDPARPDALLELVHHHTLTETLPCVSQVVFLTGDYADMTRACYWNYLRVLVPGASRLLDYATTPTPGEWMWAGRFEDGEVTVDHGPNGSREFATMVVVPTNGQRTTQLHYALPAQVVTNANDHWQYQLHLQRQAGASPLTLRVHLILPPAAQLEYLPSQATFADDTVSILIELERDTTIAVHFHHSS